MTWYTQPINDWIMGRLNVSSVTSLLPHGADSIYQGTRPQSTGAPPRFVAFDQSGSVALACLPSGKDGLQARYAVQVWEAGDDHEALGPVAAAIDARLAHVSDVQGGVAFESEAVGEVSRGAVSEGVQYVTAGGLYQITAT